MVKFGLIPDVHHSNSSCSNSSGSSSTPRHFFIPIHNTPSSTTTLQPFCIPKAFMKYLQVGKKKLKKNSHEKRGEVLEAILRSNGRGKSFHVDMVMDKDGRLMSDDEHEHHDQQVEEDVLQARGWKVFCDFHDLHMGDFLLFRHLGSLSFDVIVFDSTNCQRKYPPWDPPFFFFDHATTGKSSKTTATTPCQAKRVDDAASAGSSDDDDIPSNQFTTTLKHYTFSKWMLFFPVKFVRSNGLGNKNCTITFRDEKGRSWPIGLRYKKSSGEVYIYRGWRQFIEGNGLKEGDACTFELVSLRGTKNIIFDVHRCSKTTTPEQTKRADADGAAASGSSNENTPSNKFTTRLKPYNFSKWTMTIPAEFVRSNGLGKKNGTITFRDEKGRSWPINLRNYGSNHVNFGGGLRQFIQGNGLEEGDVCTFELVSGRGGTKNIIFDVYRGSKGTAPDQAKRTDVDSAAGSFNDDDDRPRTKPVYHPLKALSLQSMGNGSKTTTPEQTKRADADGAAASGSSNENTPSNKFTTRLKPYNFSKWTMTIPAEFVRSNGLGKKTGTITFRDEKGRSWPINLRNYGSSHVNFGGGLRQFIQGNGLEEGDVCTFELVSGRGGTKNIIFDVYRGSKGTAPDQAKRTDVDSAAGSFNDDDDRPRTKPVYHPLKALSLQSMGNGSKTTTPDQTKRADADGAAASGSSNENTPSNKFTTRLKPYNFSKWAMTIPVEFVRSNGLGEKNCMVTFRDEKWRSWSMNLRNRGNSHVIVGGGWRQFIKGNGLEEGDVCTFELVSGRGGTKNIAFHVYRGFQIVLRDDAERFQ